MGRKIETENAQIYFAHALEALGFDGDIPNIPQRWVAFLESYLVPYEPQKDLGVSYDYDAKELEQHSLVAQRKIPYNAVCAHHLLPVWGHATVAYIPQRNIVGLSKLTRLVHGITHRKPSLQEEVCTGIVEALMEHLQPLGAACIITAIHGCMACRGVEARDTETITSALRGVFFTDTSLRAELLGII